MKATKLGIWMDHEHAELTEFTELMETRIVKSKFNHAARVEVMHRGEHQMHSKEQHELDEFYKHLGEIIIKYDDVLLYGPTNAKTELYNILGRDHRFGHIKFHIEQADKMTENQHHAFVKKYFRTHS